MAAGSGDGSARRRMLCVAGVLIAAGYVLMALTRPGWLVVCYPVGNVVTSFGVVVANILQVSFQQSATPERLRGRVNATMRFLIFGVAPPVRRMRTLPQTVH